MNPSVKLHFLWPQVWNHTSMTPSVKSHFLWTQVWNHTSMTPKCEITLFMNPSVKSHFLWTQLTVKSHLLYMNPSDCEITLTMNPSVKSPKCEITLLWTQVWNHAFYEPKCEIIISMNSSVNYTYKLKCEIMLSLKSKVKHNICDQAFYEIKCCLSCYTQWQKHNACNYTCMNPSGVCHVILNGRNTMCVITLVWTQVFSVMA